MRSCAQHECSHRRQSHCWVGWLRHVYWVCCMLLNILTIPVNHLPSALTFVSSLGSTKKLPLYNALIGVCWGTGAILGPVVGGAFSTSSATWRWVRDFDAEDRSDADNIARLSTSIFPSLLSSPRCTSSSPHHGRLNLMFPSRTSSRASIGSECSSTLESWYS